MIVNSITYTPYVARNYRNRTFRGAKEEFISSGLKEFLTDTLPVYKAGRALYKLGEGDTKGAVKQGVGMVDNIVMQPTKQLAAGAMAAKGATIGSIFGPGGAALGAGIGYLGTLVCWGKVRNKIVDGIMND